MTGDQATTVQAYCAISQTIGTFLIAYLVYIAGRAIARAEYTRDTHELLNTINAIALSSTENLNALTTAVGLDSYASTDYERRKVWSLFFQLNSLQTQFLGVQAGLMDKSYAERCYMQMLDPIIIDDLTFRLVSDRSYHPDFVKFCESRRDMLKKSTGNPQAEQ